MKGEVPSILEMKDQYHHTTRLQCEGLVLGWDTTEQWKFLPDLEEQPFLEG